MGFSFESVLFTKKTYPIRISFSYVAETTWVDVLTTILASDRLKFDLNFLRTNLQTEQDIKNPPKEFWMITTLTKKLSNVIHPEVKK